MTVTRRISKIIKDGIEYNIVGGGSEAVDTQLDATSENPVQNKVIKAAIDTKLDAPAEEGEVGQFVRKGADGNEWVSGYLASIGEDYSAMQGPAPEGFHVPSTDEWSSIYNIWTALGGGTTDGTNFGIALKLPLVGYRNDDSNVSNQGSYAYYWSSTRNNANNAYSIFFRSGFIESPTVRTCSKGISVRCFKDYPVIPTSSWTKLYGTSIESGGIFWSATDGLISLSSDGQTWITIQDKNLGATQVWNNGDTLSEANCGKYYQWGNNYGFPRTGSVTTSSTQVDASAYGPGNYYSSSTFITRSSSPYDWSSVKNDNLRGGVTGVITTQLTVGEDKIGLATETSDGFMSASDKKKLDSINHLEENALVGELYTLSDTLFKQLTPTLANSTVEQKVGDTANNTQIHIQRLGSGTASNQLKLKLKKVGSPGNLTVQVMKGVKVNVSSTEAYWYGDSSNVLASGTVTSSSINTSWQEITVTLDNKVGGTEGELLDIVLSIPSVSSSKYVVLACDSTQWSEAFSFVSVNGSTRTRSKLMPYCISDGFAQSLLCKISEDGITIDQPITRPIVEFNQNYTITSNGRPELYSYTIDEGGPSSITYTLRGQSSQNHYLRINKNGTQIAQSYFGATASGTVDVVSGDVITITTHTENTPPKTFSTYYKLTGNYAKIYKKGKKVMIYNLKQIGEKILSYLFGILPDGTWRDGN